MSTKLPDALLSSLRQSLNRPDLSLAEAQNLPGVRLLLDNWVADQAPKTSDPSTTLTAFADSPAIVRAALEETYELKALSPNADESVALVSNSDILTISGVRRLRLRDEARGRLINNLRTSDLFISTLKELGDWDAENHEAVGRDPVRIRSAWLRCLLSGNYMPLNQTPWRELQAALAAREALRFVDLAPDTPTIEEITRRASLAHLLDPLRLLIGEEGGWDGTPRRDRFVGRADDLMRLRSFVDELDAQSVLEGIGRATSSITHNFIARPQLLAVVARGGMGKSTLLAKFVLDHALDQKRPFPFAYLDFDRNAIDVRRPQALLLEVARQVALQFPDAAPALDALCQSIRNETSGATFGYDIASQVTAIRDPFAQFVEIVQSSITHRERAFLLVFDTLEIVQWEDPVMERLASFVDEFRAKGMHELRVVVSGRADLASFGDNIDIARAPPIKLGALSLADARLLADKLGRTILGDEWKKSWSTAIVGNASKADEQRREPLEIRVAVDCIAQAPDEQRADIVENIDAAGSNAAKTRAERIYKNRVQKHVQNGEARDLAWPGLIVRRLTRDMVHAFLGRLCGIKPDVADEAFDTLKRELWLVIPDGDAIRHEPHLRARVLPLMRETDPALFKQVANAAADYYSKLDDTSDNKAETIYYRLLAGDPIVEHADAISPDVVARLRSALDDFAPRSDVSSFIISRSARSKLPPGKIAELTTQDALSHYREFSVNSFGLDDTIIDRPIVSLASALARMKEISPRDRRWADALCIKAGAWRDIQPSRNLSEPGPGVLVRTELYYQCRWAPNRQDDPRLNGVLMDAMRLERPGLRASAQVLALARLRAHPDFDAYDKRLADLFANTRPNPAPSTQAALRTAILFGRRCRTAAIHLWLAGRRRNVSERVREATMSSTELSILTRLHPDTSDISSTLSRNAKSRATRFSDEPTLSAAHGVIEDLVDDLAESDGQDALSFLFSRRDEDWIVPIGYAIARAFPNAKLPKELLQRVANYSSKSGGVAPKDALGAVRWADEASDLHGFIDHVLELAPANQSSDLKNLNALRKNWRNAIDDIVRPPELIFGSTERPAKGPRPPEPPPIFDPSDPQKGRWGGQSEREGRRVRATLESVEKDIFYFGLTVESTDKSELKAPVVFHLHDSFPRNVIHVRRIVERRYAQLLEWNAYGVFCIGVQVLTGKGKWISLELDLKDLPGLPTRFLNR